MRPALLAVAAILAVCLAWLALLRPGVAAERPVALFTTLPILWPEARDMTELLDAREPPHWAVEALGGTERVRALDMLIDADGRLPLSPDVLLVMAQPRPLAPQENVALDEWVRAGGRVLLFADPMLTAESIFPLGDRRRPQDVALLSPILARWGLELRFDEAQPLGAREAPLLGLRIPVNLAGSFALAGAAQRCSLMDGGLAARCRIGEGEVLAVADAALLERGAAQDRDLRRTAVLRLRDSLP